jgi:tetratricopeptide (TPR) repeat protein
MEGDEGNRKMQASLLKRYVRLRPDQATAFDQLGHARAIAHNPEYSEAIYSLARALQLTDPVESKRLMQRAQELGNNRRTVDRVNMLGNQANAKMFEANYKGAIDDLKNAIVLCGRCKLLGALEKNLGLAYCHAGQLDAGERELKIVQTLIPEDASVEAALRTVRQQRAQISNSP